METPTNRSTLRSQRTVEERKPSKEFTIEGDHLTVEVVHAERILREYFEKLGYEEWIYGSCCSRKLLEKVQQRIPNALYLPPEEVRRPIQVGQWIATPTPYHQVQEGPEPRPFTVADMPPTTAEQQMAADYLRTEQARHDMERALRQQVQAHTNIQPDGTPYQGTAGGPASDPAHDTPF